MNKTESYIGVVVIVGDNEPWDRGFESGLWQEYLNA